MTTTATGDLYYFALTSAFNFNDFANDYSTAIYKSTDGGQSFSATATGLGVPGLGSIDVFKEVNGELWFGGNAGFKRSSDWFFRSADGGVTWASTGTGQDVRPIDFSSDGGIFYAFTSSYRTWRSTDNGATWTDFANGYDQFPSYETIGDRRFYRYDGSIRISDDGGATRTQVVATTRIPAAILPFRSSIYSHSAGFAPIYRSADNGATWEILPTIPGYPDLRIQQMFLFGGRLFAVSSNQFSGNPSPLLFTDDGETWVEFILPNQPIPVTNTAVSGTRLISLKGTELKSIDLGPSPARPPS